MSCAQCGTDNPPGARFCGGCGAALAQGCPSCGGANDPGMRFCNHCGAALEGSTEAPPAARVAPARVEPAAERRLVSVLFADLVGFTTLSESRDSEEVRELLTQYFETCRSIVGRYGGIVEKFIGDAVMAVWGTPIAQEDDAERSVRAALDLVAAVPELHRDLRARAGVLTGEAAVTLGAEGQGMVAGDLVNTASRIQSEAEPGTVLVGDTTRWATESSIAYESVGEFELKGKSEPMSLSRALRVTAGRGGALKSVGLEPPFVGRDRELRLVKELYHGSEQEGRAQLVSVVGIGGIGKSRLAWEFFKYIDGLEDLTWWHRGRCLAYGEGVAFWALAEMVRGRAGIVEGEEPAAARVKLHASVEEFVVGEDDRRFVEPRVAHLLGLNEAGSYAKDELFGAWRLFFEQMAAQGPVALVFEDLQWADAALVEFISHLLEWSRSQPIFVLCLARPELQEQHPDFGHGSRNQMTLALDPLSARAMEELLDGLVPGLPGALREQILARAEGVPLYAVETIRMLLDRGLLHEHGGVYEPTGEIAELDVPETLQGLIAARLDGLGADERRLLQDASVLGKTFSRDALVALSGLDTTEVESLLGPLVHKEVLTLQVDPRSPERGQYGFLQDLVRRVAYETLARKERKARHVAAATHLAETYGPAEREIVEVLASHYLAAYDAQPDAEDAPELRARAKEALTRAGERAGSLGATAEAGRSLARAAELEDDPVARALVLERAGEMAFFGADYEAAEGHLTQALADLEAHGAVWDAARVTGLLARTEVFRGQATRARERLERALASLADEEPDAGLARLSAQLAFLNAVRGDLERGLELADEALRLAQALRVPEALVLALSAKAVLLGVQGRPEEAMAHFRHALYVAEEADLRELYGHALGNLSDACFQADRYRGSLELLDDLLERARRLGNRGQERYSLAEISYAQTMCGEWDRALGAYHELVQLEGEMSSIDLSPVSGVLGILVHRGDVDGARALLDSYAHLRDDTDAAGKSIMGGAEAEIAVAEGRYADALRVGGEAAAAQIEIGNQGVKQSLVWAVEGALALGDRERAVELLGIVESLPVGLRPPYLEAQAQRFRARMDNREDGFKTAESLFGDFEIPFWLAVTQLEHGEWLVAQGRAQEAEPLLATARETFERLEAGPWLERLERAAADAAQVASTVEA